ncbi:LegC family aminotransferase [Oleomonas cavernae]|uniref:LegC family aminotransferase n=1 Tax=Oleomonas cavernae TaxID=2320859 RepID=A0A418WAP2_9PROT|nr:LegC family aminotransferase [Oleomonas cavernae]RJF87090.1 LegC family aminotransferase [Oleomonas cavernae]
MHPLSDRLRRIIRDDLCLEGQVPLHTPVFRGREWDYVKDCLDTGWVSSVGAYVDRFEAAMAARAGTRFAVATVNGTAALHASLHALGVGPGDLVVCPTLTFVASANAIAYCGATPLLADSEPTTLGLDAAALDDFLRTRAVRRPDGLFLEGRRIAAVLPVHIFGHAADLTALAELCLRWDLPMVEDASEALGTLHRGRPCGGVGRIGTFSFNGNKIVTTGGGGMIVTDDEALARRLKHLTTTARVKHDWQFLHDEVGFNYRLPNLNAALGLAQVEALDELITAKRRVAAWYRRALAGLDGVTFLDEPQGDRSIFWLNAALVEDQAARDAVLAQSNAMGIDTRPAWVPMHELPAFNAAPRTGSLSVALDIIARLVNLPSSAWLADHLPVANDLLTLSSV